MEHDFSPRLVLQQSVQFSAHLRAVFRVGVTHRRHPACHGGTVGIPSHTPSTLVCIVKPTHRRAAPPLCHTLHLHWFVCTKTTRLMFDYSGKLGRANTRTRPRCGQQRTCHLEKMKEIQKRYFRHFQYADSCVRLATWWLPISVLQ